MRKTKTASDLQCFYNGFLTPLFGLELKYTYAAKVTKITVSQKFMVLRHIQTALKSIS